MRDLEALVATCPAAGSEPDPDPLAAALKPFMEPDRQMRAAAELLLVSRYDPELSAAVHGTLSPRLTEWLSQADARADPAQAAKRAFLLILGLGLLAHGRSFQYPIAEFGAQIERIDSALRSPAVPTTLPPDSATYVDELIDFGTGEPAMELLLGAIVDLVGTRGYEAATIDEITAEAQCTRGLLFARYESKRDLFIDATDRMFEQGVNVNAAFAQRISESHGPGVADAVLMREASLPSRRMARTLMLEQHRLSWHDEQIQAKVASAFAEAAWALEQQLTGSSPEVARSRIHLEIAIGQGMTILADLSPEAAGLPMDVVTVPLADLP